MPCPIPTATSSTPSEPYPLLFPSIFFSPAPSSCSGQAKQRRNRRRPPIPGRASSDSFHGCLANLVLHLHRTAPGPAELYPGRIGPRSGQSPWKPCSKLRPSLIRSVRSSSTRIEAAVSSTVLPPSSPAPSPTYIVRPLAGTSSPSQLELLLRSRPPTNHLRSRFLHQTGPRYARCTTRGREAPDVVAKPEDGVQWTDPEDGRTVLSACLD
ncbi:uncharacterized protein LOC120672339 [Panicum virgatum]|uniref:uncharacterized protein LOC120672339 n=1 Tax=Panicum virgatum TaxID=38727 RepID=UPI0019D5AC05|nr:uncharacterized protein LOC120672339 [Panicum virgatum]